MAVFVFASQAQQAFEESPQFSKTALNIYFAVTQTLLWYYTLLCGLSLRSPLAAAAAVTTICSHLKCIISIT